MQLTSSPLLPSPSWRGHSATCNTIDWQLRTTLEEIVARVFDVQLDHLRLPTRGPARVAIARQVTMYLGHVTCGLSLTEVGQLFERDRTTVAHACQVVEDRRENQDFDRAIELLENIAKILAFTPAR